MLSKSINILFLNRNSSIARFGKRVGQMAASTNSASEQKEAADEKSRRDKFEQLKHMATRPLYLDAQATSPVDPRVLDAMLPYMTNMYGNPHSRTHAYGWESEKAVEDARQVLILAVYRSTHVTSNNLKTLSFSL